MRVLNWLRLHRISAGLSTLGVLALGTATLLLSLKLTSATEAASPRLVLFSAAGELDSFFADETAKTAGFTVAHSWQELKSKTGSHTAAVAFTNATRDSLNAEWLRGKYHDGTVIVGINVAAGNLGEMVGDPDPSTSARGITYTRNFFSEAYRVECGGGGSRRLGAYPIENASDFVTMLEIDLAQVRTVCDQFNPSPTSTS